MSTSTNTTEAAAQAGRRILSVIPRPALMTPGEGEFVLGVRTPLLAGTGAAPEARALAEALAPALGHMLEVLKAPAPDPALPPASGAILLELDPEALGHLGPEGYTLTVTPDSVRLTAPRPAGLFYAAQTLRQLLPPEIFSAHRVSGVEWAIPCVTIEDTPRFSWRGHLFDTCRHFFTVEEVKRAIDLMALHKMNRFHWHLTEDQGWRLEIKRYPRLTDVGSWRTERDGTRYGGFYTQDEVREVVGYAAERHVTVVPEIELPGHSLGALAAYPELGCTGGPYHVEHNIGIFRDVYCAGQEKAFAFLENVLEEVLALFPSPWIHIGGDECPKHRWKECPRCQERIRAEGLKDEHELQSWFIRRFDRFLAGRGRRLIGWDEILEGGLAPGAIVESWRGVKGGIEAASAGHDVIMSPVSHCYLDYSYLSIPLEKAYEYEPVPPELPADKEHHVLGLEGNMWTEWVHNAAEYDFQVYPRLTALAEVGWSPREARDWADFRARMDVHEKRYAALGVNPGEPEELNLEGSPVVGGWSMPEAKEEITQLEFDVTAQVTVPGIYETIFWFTDGDAAVWIEDAVLLVNGRETAADNHLGWSGFDKRLVVYSLPVGSADPSARYTLRCRIRPIGGTISHGDVYFRLGK